MMKKKRERKKQKEETNKVGKGIATISIIALLLIGIVIFVEWGMDTFPCGYCATCGTPYFEKSGCWVYGLLMLVIVLCVVAKDWLLQK